jgi:hypothetical protein
MRRVTLSFTWIERNRRRDPDNITAGGRKIILDALVQAKILDDDSSHYVLGWTDAFMINKDAPGVRVELREG